MFLIPGYLVKHLAYRKQSITIYSGVFDFQGRESLVQLPASSIVPHSQECPADVCGPQASQGTLLNLALKFTQQYLSPVKFL